jgi:AcrR family transcriptional regulator
METVKKSRKKTAAGVSAAVIKKAYREFLMKEGKKPSSVFTFCQLLGLTEAEFYSHFGSMEAIEKAIWQGYIVDTRNRLEADEAFVAFSAREKILTFYFTLAESLKNERSFVLHQMKGWDKPGMMPAFLKGFKNSFDDWIKGVVAAGVQSGEIAKRPYLDDRYHILFWLHLMFILQFWSNDESAGFEKTDAAIEKSVNLAFDLIGKGILDNAIDFGKFLYQTAKN